MARRTRTTSMAPLKPASSADLQARLFDTIKQKDELEKTVDSLQDCCHELQHEVRQKTLCIDALRESISTLDSLYSESSLRCERLELKLSSLTFVDTGLLVDDPIEGSHHHHRRHHTRDYNDNNSQTTSSNSSSSSSSKKKKQKKEKGSSSNSSTSSSKKDKKSSRKESKKRGSSSSTSSNKESNGSKDRKDKTSKTPGGAEKSSSSNKTKDKSKKKKRKKSESLQHKNGRILPESGGLLQNVAEENECDHSGSPSSMAKIKKGNHEKSPTKVISNPKNSKEAKPDQASPHANVGTTTEEKDADEPKNNKDKDDVVSSLEASTDSATASLLDNDDSSDEDEEEDDDNSVTPNDDEEDDDESVPGDDNDDDDDDDSVGSNSTPLYPEIKFTPDDDESSELSSIVEQGYDDDLSAVSSKVDEENENGQEKPKRRQSRSPQTVDGTKNIIDESAIADNLTEGKLRSAFFHLLLQRDQAKLKNLQLQRKLNQSQKEVEELSDKLSKGNTYVSLRYSHSPDSEEVSQYALQQQGNDGYDLSEDKRVSDDASASSDGMTAKIADALHPWRNTINNASNKPLKWLMKGQKIAHLNTAGVIDHQPPSQSRAPDAAPRHRRAWSSPRARTDVSKAPEAPVVKKPEPQEPLTVTTETVTFYPFKVGNVGAYMTPSELGPDSPPSIRRLEI